VLAALVGKRLRIYWEHEGKWYSGCAKSYSSRRGLLVLYDDGDVLSYTDEESFEYKILDP